MVEQHKSGTAFVIKGEPSATDAALLRLTLTEGQKTELRQIMGVLVRTRCAGILKPDQPD